MMHNYKQDMAAALEHLAIAEDRLNTAYVGMTPAAHSERAKQQMRGRMKRKLKISNEDCDGPPDKRRHLRLGML